MVEGGINTSGRLSKAGDCIALVALSDDDEVSQVRLGAVEVERGTSRGRCWCGEIA
jgi:hypothetical protein